MRAVALTFEMSSDKGFGFALITTACPVMLRGMYALLVLVLVVAVVIAVIKRI